MKLQIEINTKAVKEDMNFVTPSGNMIMVTPKIGEDFWLMRVPLSKKQAIVCFPKFFTIGCGFQIEIDWNTNLPLSCDTEEIFNHIKHNKGDKKIPDSNCRKAIDMLRDKVKEMGAI